MCVYFVANLCAVRFGLGWAHDVFKFAYHKFMHFHAYIPLILYFHIYFVLLVLFWLSLSLSPSLFLTLVCTMAPKCKSTPSQNPLCSGASTSSFDPTPSHVWFRDDKAHKDFSENFSRQGIHSERQVILSDLFDTDLPTIIYNRVWSHCVVPRSLVPPWSYLSFTPICTESTLLYLISSLTFEVRAS